MYEKLIELYSMEYFLINFSYNNLGAGIMFLSFLDQIRQNAILQNGK